MLEERVLSDAEFPAFGERVVLFCHVTSQVADDPDQGLLQEKGGEGFPYLVFMRPSGDVLAVQRDRRVVAFAAKQAACERYLELSARAAEGDETVGVDLLIARIEMGVLTLAEARKAVAALGEIAADRRARIAELLLELEVDETVRQVSTRTQAIDAGRQFRRMWDEGRVPAGRPALVFFHMILEAAYADRDPALYERALGEFDKAAASSPNRERMLASLRKRLDEIRKQ
jgi:hypothetical protein